MLSDFTSVDGVIVCTEKDEIADDNNLGIPFKCLKKIHKIYGNLSL